MLKPRFPWMCGESGCCVFVGGTRDYDIYMTNCNRRAWNPGVLLVPEEAFMFIEFNDVDELIHKHKQLLETPSKEDREMVEKLGLALTFVQCFFPTPERVTLDQIRKDEYNAAT